MNNRFMTFMFAGLVAGTMLSTAAIAQEDPGHPRVSEIDQRLDNQQNRTNAGVNDGQMNPGEAAHDEKRDQHVENQLHRDEAKNGGHITKAEQRHMNKELNHNSKDIHRQRHPRKHPTAQ